MWIEISANSRFCAAEFVTPRAGVWIEMEVPEILKDLGIVTPRAGVWIEIPPIPAPSIVSVSLPVRECGLKLICSKIY